MNITKEDALYYKQKWCEHNNLEYIPQEDDVNVREDVLCLDCGKSLMNEIEE